MKRLYLVPFGVSDGTRRLFLEALGFFNPEVTFDFSSIWYIAPTPRKVREAEKIFASLVEKKRRCFIPPRFRTLKTLALELYSGKKRFLPDYLKPVFLYRGKGSLSFCYYLGELIKDFKSANLFWEKWEETEGMIERELSSFPSEQERLRRVFGEIERYQEECQRRGFLDAEDLMKEVCEKRKRRGVLLLDGFMDLTKLEEEFIKYLVFSFEDVFALAYYDPYEEDPNFLPKEFSDFLLSLSSFSIVKVKGSEDWRKRREMNFFAFPSREEEVEWIARSIREVASERKVPLHKILVTFPDLESYSGIIERVFKKHRIPFTIYPLSSLLSSPVVLPVVALLRATLEDYPRIPTLFCLTSPFFSRLSERTREILPHLSYLGGITKGEGNWRNLTRELRKKSEKEIKKNSLFTVERDINLFLSLTKGLKKETSSLSNFLSLTEEVLKELKWAEGLEEEYLLEEKREFLSVFRGLRLLSDIECSFEGFVEIVEEVLKYHRRIPDREERGVRVLGLLETRGLEAEIIFFGGLSEESLPSRKTLDPFLPDWLRKKLGLLNYERHTAWQKLHFERVLGMPKEVFLSYPLKEGERKFLPSPYLEGEPVLWKKGGNFFTEEEMERKRGEREGRRFLPEVIDFKKDKDVRRVLKRRFSRYIEVTEIERFRRCPYSFYLERVLGLEEKKDSLFTIEPVEWGETVHSLLQKVYSEDGKVFAPSLDEIPERVNKILSSLLLRKDFPPFWRDVAQRTVERILPDFIEKERQLRDEGFLPFRVEEAVKGFLLPGIMVYGKIDRIDKKRDSDEFLILDYKTGVTEIYPGDIEKGRHLQLPLYSYLLRQKGYNVTGFGVYYFGRSDSELRPCEWKILGKGEEDCRQKEERASVWAKEAVSLLLSGSFPAEPQENACFFCPYSFLCPREYSG